MGDGKVTPSNCIILYAHSGVEKLGVVYLTFGCSHKVDLGNVGLNCSVVRWDCTFKGFVQLVVNLCIWKLKLDPMFAFRN